MSTYNVGTINGLTLVTVDDTMAYEGDPRIEELDTLTDALAVLSRTKAWEHSPALYIIENTSDGKKMLHMRTGVYPISQPWKAPKLVREVPEDEFDADAREWVE